MCLTNDNVFKKLNKIRYTKQFKDDKGEKTEKFLPIKTYKIYDFIKSSLKVLNNVNKIDSLKDSETILKEFKENFSLDKLEENRKDYESKKKKSSDPYPKFEQVFYLREFLNKLLELLNKLHLKCNFNNCIGDAILDCNDYITSLNLMEDLFKQYKEHFDSIYNLCKKNYIQDTSIDSALPGVTVKDLNECEEDSKDLVAYASKRDYDGIVKILKKYISSRKCYLYSLPTIVFTKFGPTQKLLLEGLCEDLDKIISEKIKLNDIRVIRLRIKEYSNKKILIFNFTQNYIERFSELNSNILEDYIKKLNPDQQDQISKIFKNIESLNDQLVIKRGERMKLFGQNAEEIKKVDHEIETIEKELEKEKKNEKEIVGNREGEKDLIIELKKERIEEAKKIKSIISKEKDSINELMKNINTQYSKYESLLDDFDKMTNAICWS